MNEYEEAKQKRYEEVKSKIDMKMQEGYLPNIKAMEKEVRILKRRVKSLHEGAILFAKDLDEAEKANQVLGRLDGEIAAYQVFIDIYYSYLNK